VNTALKATSETSKLKKIYPARRQQASQLKAITICFTDTITLIYYSFIYNDIRTIVHITSSNK